MTTYPTLHRLWMPPFPSLTLTDDQASDSTRPRQDFLTNEPSSSAGLSAGLGARPPALAKLPFLPQALPSLLCVLTSSSRPWRPQPLLSAVSLQNAPQSLSQDCPHLVSLPCQAPVGSSLHSLPLQPPFALQPAGAWPRPSASSELPPWKYEGPQC